MTRIRRISRTVLWAICKLFFIFYMINSVLSLPFSVMGPYPHPMENLVAILIVLPVALLARRAYIRLEQ